MPLTALKVSAAAVSVKVSAVGAVRLTVSLAPTRFTVRVWLSVVPAPSLAVTAKPIVVLLVSLSISPALAVKV